MCEATKEMPEHHSPKATLPSNCWLDTHHGEGTVRYHGIILGYVNSAMKVPPQSAIEQSPTYATTSPRTNRPNSKTTLLLRLPRDATRRTSSLGFTSQWNPEILQNAQEHFMKPFRYHLWAHSFSPWIKPLKMTHARYARSSNISHLATTTDRYDPLARSGCMWRRWSTV